MRSSLVADKASLKYVEALRLVPSVFVLLESLLASFHFEVELDVEMIRRLTNGAVAEEQIRLAMKRLTDLGALDQVPGRRWRFRPEQFGKSAEFRRGAAAAVALAPRRADDAMLVAALPDSLDEIARRAIRDRATDLTAAIIDLIASAKETLLLASPYWDDATIEELEPILRRRLEDGLRLTILARSASKGTDAGQPIASFRDRMSAYDAIRICTWYDPDPSDPWGSRTFHFKAAVADEGQRGYLGSANFTSGGLRSRLELGVMLTGRPAQMLYDVLEAVVGVASTSVRS